MFSVLVHDNAPIHKGRIGELMHDKAWNYTDPRYYNNEPLRLLILFLPTRYFELNPMENVFGMMRNMAEWDDDFVKMNDGYDVARALDRAMVRIKPNQVFGCFKLCGYNW